MGLYLVRRQYGIDEIRGVESPVTFVRAIFTYLRVPGAVLYATESRRSRGSRAVYSLLSLGQDCLSLKCKREHSLLITELSRVR